MGIALTWRFSGLGANVVEVGTQLFCEQMSRLRPVALLPGISYRSPVQQVEPGSPNRKNPALGVRLPEKDQPDLPTEPQATCIRARARAV